MSGAPRVLFVNSDKIGDCVMFSGVLEEVLRRVPDARVTVACGPTAAPLFRAAPGVVDVVALKKKPMGGHWADLWRRAWPTRWRMVIDVRGSILAWLLRAEERRVYRRTMEQGDPKVVTISRMMGSDVPLDPAIAIDEAARAAAVAILGEGPGPVMALSPISTVAERSWPADRWAELVRRLAAEPALAEWRFAVVGGPGDHAAAAPALAAAGDRAVDAVGKSDILGSAAVIAACDLFVGNDSGLMHVSAAVGTPTLGLFGPSEWWHKAPWGPGHAVVASAPVRGTFAPIEDLTVDRVFSAVMDLHRASSRG